MSFHIDINTVLLSLIGGLLTILIWFVKRSYDELVSNQKDLYSRQNKADNRITAIEERCRVRHGGSK